MTTHRNLFFLVVTAAAATLAGAADPTPTPPAPIPPPASASAAKAPTPTSGIKRAAWLEGCWEQVANGRTVEEHWLGPRGRNMMMIGRTMRGDTLVEHETVILREEGDRLAYEAHPSGQPSTVFLSKIVTDSSLLFENLEHDFPQRVGYDHKDGGLIGWIEGTKDGKTRRIEFPYTRVACSVK